MTRALNVVPNLQFTRTLWEEDNGKTIDATFNREVNLLGEIQISDKENPNRKKIEDQGQ